MLVSVEGRVTDFRFSHPIKVNSSIFLTPSGITTSTRLWHPKKALLPMVFTESGSQTLPMAVFWKAAFPMVWKVEGRFTLCRELSL